MKDPGNKRFDDFRILESRGPKNPVDPFIPYGYFTEKERTPTGRVEDFITIFLTNRECRYRCLMCDLWKNTTDEPVPEGAIPAQIEYALGKLPPAKHLKLYNSANFFDPGSIPPSDYRGIARLIEGFDTLIVENHPRLTGERVLEFASLIRPRLKVAMGLETVHPEVLDKLNKRMNLKDFSRAAELLSRHGIGARAFILLKPPFLSEEEGMLWAERSIDFAFDSGMESCTIIPTRSGNGAMDILRAEGLFSPPAVQSLEKVLQYGIRLGRGMVFADTWDLELFSSCSHCLEARKNRIELMNHSQEILPPVRCECET